MYHTVCVWISVELESEDPEVVFSARQKITTLSSCFAQLTHKALTIFQSNAKLEVSMSLCLR